MNNNYSASEFGQIYDTNDIKRRQLPVQRRGVQAIIRIKVRRKQVRAIAQRL